MALASELLDVDDLGYAKKLNDGAVPMELEEKVRVVVDNC